MSRSSSYWDATRDMPGRDPRLHVVNAFRDLELAAMLARDRLTGATLEKPEEIITRLREQGLIAPAAEELYLKLKQMRDDVAEGRVLPNVDEALQYAQLVGDTLPYIRSQAKSCGSARS